MWVPGSNQTTLIPSVLPWRIPGHGGCWNLLSSCRGNTCTAPMAHTGTAAFHNPSKSQVRASWVEMRRAPLIHFLPGLAAFSVKFPAACWAPLSRQIRPSERSRDLSKGNVVFLSRQTKEPQWIEVLLQFLHLTTRPAAHTNSLPSPSVRNSSCPANHASITFPSVASALFFPLWCQACRRLSKYIYILFFF